MGWLSFNLFFTIVMWVFFSIVLISNHRNHLNRCCFFTGILFSLGVFKEYLYYDLAPIILSSTSPLVSVDCVTKFYSFITSVLYLCAMPAAFLFGLYFCDYPKSQPTRFRYILYSIPIPILLLAIFFPPFQTHALQQVSLAFWVSVSIYNLIYGGLFTALLFHGVRREQNVEIRRQKRLVALLIIPLIWYALITIFVIHTLRLNTFFKLWQGNVLLFAVALCFYIGMAFREGIMGIKLNAEHYQWELETQVAFQGVQFVSHVLNRDLTKLEWCATSLTEQYPSDPPRELQIISQAVDRLRGLAVRTCLYSGELLLNPEGCLVHELLRDCDMDAYQNMGIKVIVSCSQGCQIHCDRRHTTEVLRNLFANAAEAVNPANGIIQISFASNIKTRHHKGAYNVVTVSDNGCGISTDKIQFLFRPYQTDKAADDHLGLGLFYCLRVMRGQNGFIEVKSDVGKGSEFQLCFPAGRSTK